jgi:iron transport multicopper oxidase
VLLRSFPIGESAKFATPGIGGGRLYVGTRDGHVRAFGSPVATPLSGAPVEFSTTTIGTEVTKTETLKANEPLELTSLSSSSTEFKLGSPSRSLPTKLNGGDEIQVPVTFSPSGTGPRGGTLTANTSRGEVQFSMTGSGQAVGPKLEASPTVLSFGGTTLGGSVSGTATFRNVGGSTVTINGVHAPSGPFTAEGLPKKGESIAPGKAINVPITFKPSELGSFESSVLLETNGGSEQVRLTASAATPGVLSISPEAADFGSVAVGSEATRSFTVANTGGSAITIFKSKPPTGGEFTAISALPEDTTIAPGETLAETVAFQPTATGRAGGMWLINGQGSSAVHEVMFSGTGVPPTAAPPPPPSLVQQLGNVLNFQSTPFGAFLTSRTLLARPSGKLHVRLYCPARAASCTGTIALRTVRAVRVTSSQRVPAVLTVASGRFRIAHGGSAMLDLRLTKGGRTLLARQRTLRVQASTLTQEDGAGRPQLVRVIASLHAATGLRAH